MIRIAGLGYGRATGRGGPILDGIDLVIAEGTVACLLGPNGAGKSTLLGCLLGLLHGWTGSIRLAGRDVRALCRRDAGRLAAYVPQFSTPAFAFTVEQLVVMGRTPHFGVIEAPRPADRRAAEAAMTAVGIVDLRHRPLTELSGGERQLAHIARAVAQECPLVVMDEPMASLDLGNQGRVLALIGALARQGRTILLTTHLPDHAFALDADVVLLKSGHVVGAGPSATVCTSDAMSRLYGGPVRVVGDHARRAAACIPDPDLLGIG